MVDGQCEGGMDCVVATFFTWLIPVLFVLLMYAFDFRGTNRDAPGSIARRFAGVVVACCLTAYLTVKFVGDDFTPVEFGLRFNGLLAAISLPLILTSVGFLGPIVQAIYEERRGWRCSLRSAVSGIDAVWMRNHVLAPVSEEFAFRACTVALLRPCFSFNDTLLLSPLPFALIHFHHGIRLLRHGHRFGQVALCCAFQVMYTYLFGIYATYIFIRTGHLLAAIIAHAFCNHMGFPDIEGLCYLGTPQKCFIGSAFVLGFVAWLSLLSPLTAPSLYSLGAVATS